MTISRSTHCFDDYRIGLSPVVTFLFGLIELLSMVVLILVAKMRCCIVNKQKGGVTAVLPIYYFAMFYTIALGIILGVSSLIGINPLFIFAQNIFWILSRSCSEGLSVFLLHNGIGYKAMRTSILLGVSWGIFSGITPMIVFLLSSNRRYFVLTILFLLFLLFIFYLSTLVLPQEVLHRRPALRRFAIQSLFVLSLMILANGLYLRNFSSSSCSVEILYELCNFLQLLIILMALRQDSLFWQGLYYNPVSNLNEPLLGVWELGRETINIVADSINQLERKVVPIIPFGSLRVDTGYVFELFCCCSC